jgi:hypothetical protein
MNWPSKTVAALSVVLLLSASLAMWMWERLTVARAELAAARAALEVAHETVAVLRASAKVEARAAAQREKWKQKAAGKAKRVAAAIPVAGTIAAIWFEEHEYREWRQEHAEFTDEAQARKAYYKQTYDLCIEVLDEEFEDLKRTSPEAWAKVQRAIRDWYGAAVSSLPP